jgi:hypothetical protein
MRLPAVLSAFAGSLLLLGLSQFACTRTVYVERPVPIPPPPPQPVQVIGAAPAGEVIVAQPPAPPAPVTEVVTVSPGPEDVWINGDYEWVGGRWVWYGGHWGRPIHPAAIWVRGGWRPVRGGHIWERAHWR